MPFQNTPEDTPTGSFQEATVDTTETEEVWIEHTVREDGEEVTKSFGFILIPPRNVPYRKKTEKIQEAAAKSRGSFNFQHYYNKMLEYQIQETSFGADDKLSTWLTSVPSELAEKLEEHVPDPMDKGEDGIAEGVVEVVEEYAAGPDGSMDDTLQEFIAFLKSEAIGEDEEGKSDGS